MKYLQMYGHHDKNSILLTGFQGENTIGRLLSEGEKDININGQNLHIKANIYQIHSLSAHADRDALTEFALTSKKIKKVFLNHGEEISVHSLKEHILKKQTQGLEVVVARRDKDYEL